MLILSAKQPSATKTNAVVNCSGRNGLHVQPLAISVEELELERIYVHLSRFKQKQLYATLVPEITVIGHLGVHVHLRAQAVYNTENKAIHVAW